jgi:hypothetical protein
LRFNYTAVLNILKLGKLRKDDDARLSFEREEISLRFSTGSTPSPSSVKRADGVQPRPNVCESVFPISWNYPGIVDVKPMFHVRHCNAFNTETMTVGTKCAPNTAPSREPSVILPKVVSAR